MMHRSNKANPINKREGSNERQDVDVKILSGRKGEDKHPEPCFFDS